MFTGSLKTYICDDVLNMYWMCNKAIFKIWKIIEAKRRPIDDL